MQLSHYLKRIAAISPFVLSMMSGSAVALQAMNESEMSGVTGAGLALGFDDYYLQMAPTSYLEITGSTPTAAALAAGWRRGDVRYYGFSITDGTSGNQEWFSAGGASACSGSYLCPIGGATDNFSPIDNPYVLRAFQYSALNPSGAAVTPTVLELVAPSDSGSWRWAFWGQIEVDRFGDTGTPGLLQSQTIINGANHTTDGTPSIFRMFRTEGSGTLGLTYQSALSGDFRFSVAQEASSPNTLNSVPNFDNTEGVHFKNVDAFLPLGRLHSQPLRFDTVGDGNFIVELEAIPNVANVYNNIYCGSNLTDTSACATATESVDFFGRSVTAIASPNSDTHGYVRWGDMSAGVGTPGTGTYGTNTTNNTTNGIFFVDSTANGSGVTNIGTARMEGMLVQYLKLTTTGI